MKLSEATPKIVGVQVGEAALNFIRVGEPALKVRFALISKDGNPVGFVDVGEWSDKVLAAMRTFSEALEEEALSLIFEQSTQDVETPQAEERQGPPQF